MQQVPVLVPQSSYGDGNTTVVIARIYCILRGCYDVVWGTLEFPSFNFNGIFDRFCILKGMLYMMPLSRHALSLQTRLHRQFILGSGPKRARLGPAARLGPQPPGVRLELRMVHGGIIFEILAKGSKSP